MAMMMVVYAVLVGDNSQPPHGREKGGIRRKWERKRLGMSVFIAQGSVRGIRTPL